MSVEVIKKLSQRTLAYIASAVLFSTSILMILQGSASAVSQLTSRSVTMGSAVPSAATQTYTFGFTVPSVVIVQSMQFQFCDSPIAVACNGTNNPTIGATAVASQSGWSQTPAWASPTVVTDAGTGGTATANEIKITRTGGTSGSTESAVAKTIAFNTITNNATANKTFYVRIRLYSDSTWTTLVNDGKVAGSTTQSLTINARVQEQLSFCVGTTTTDAVGANGTQALRNAGNTADVTSCTLADGTSVDLGAISSTATSITPVAASPNGGDARNAYAMISTNAINGATVSYRAIPDTGGSLTGRLRVSGATCSGTSSLDASSGSNDQCFNSSTTQTVLAAGTEEFGMTIAGVSCFNVPAAGSGGYTCNYATPTNNLTPQAGYIGAAANAYGVTNGFAWRADGTAVTIASSTASTIKVISNEALILKFGATAATTTPTGSYTTVADFIALATF
jgi:hypothetical protein